MTIYNSNHTKLLIERTFVKKKLRKMRKKVTVDDIQSTWGEMIYKYVSVFLQRDKKEICLCSETALPAGNLHSFKERREDCVWVKNKPVVRGFTYMQSVQNHAPLSPLQEISRKQKFLFFPVDVSWFRIVLYVFVCNYPFIPVLT